MIKRICLYDSCEFISDYIDDGYHLCPICRAGTTPVEVDDEYHDEEPSDEAQEKKFKKAVYDASSCPFASTCIGHGEYRPECENKRYQNRCTIALNLKIDNLALKLNGIYELLHNDTRLC